MLFSSQDPTQLSDGTSAFMGVVGLAVVLLFIVFLYLNKRLCVYTHQSHGCSVTQDVLLNGDCDDGRKVPDKNCRLHENASPQWLSQTGSDGGKRETTGCTCGSDTRGTVNCAGQGGSPAKIGNRASSRGNDRLDDKSSVLAGNAERHNLGIAISNRGDCLSRRAAFHQQHSHPPPMNTQKQQHHSVLDTNYPNPANRYQYHSLQRLPHSSSLSRTNTNLQHPHYSSLQTSQTRQHTQLIQQNNSHHVNFNLINNNDAQNIESHNLNSQHNLNQHHHHVQHHSTSLQQPYHCHGRNPPSLQVFNAERVLGVEHSDLCRCDASTNSDLTSLADGRATSPKHRHHDNGNMSPGATRSEAISTVEQTGTIAVAGVGGSSSASSSGSTTSCDDDILAHRCLRHRDTKGYLGTEPALFMQGGEDGLFSRCCGSLEVGFAYDQPTRILTTHILQAKDVPARDSGGPANCQVRIMLVPGRRQKHKTRIRLGVNPQFNEAFVFRKINPEELLGMGLRYRLYGCERMRRERLLGEVLVPLSSVNLAMANTLWMTLEPRANMMPVADERAEVCSLPRSDSTGSNNSVHGAAPGLLLGLTYNGTTGRLAVEVIKGSHFRTSEDSSGGVSNPRAPDSLVKICLTSSNGQEIANAKTTIRRGQPNPLFKETFMFQVALFQLPDVTLLVSVYAKKNMKRKNMIGWFTLGLNSSGEEELAHWNQMRDSKGSQVCRWHSLLVA